jgi:DNA topoisomerase-2
VRRVLYEKRSQKILAVLRKKCKDLSEKVRFLTLVIEGKIELRNAPKKKLEESLASHKFQAPYDPYLTMPLWSITREKIEALRKESNAATTEYKKVYKMTGNDLWENDLKSLSGY